MKLKDGQELPHDTHNQHMLNQLLAKTGFDKERFLADFGEQLKQYDISTQYTKPEKLD